MIVYGDAMSSADSWHWKKINNAGIRWMARKAKEAKKIAVSTCCGLEFAYFEGAIWTDLTRIAANVSTVA